MPHFRQAYKYTKFIVNSKQQNDKKSPLLGEKRYLCGGFGNYEREKFHLGTYRMLYGIPDFRTQHNSLQGLNIERYNIAAGPLHTPLTWRRPALLVYLTIHAEGAS